MAFQDAFVRTQLAGDMGMSYGARVTAAGHIAIRAGESNPPANQRGSHPGDSHRGTTWFDYRLILISDGAGEFESEAAGSVPIRGSALIVLSPGVWYRLRPAADTGWSERWIAFDGDLATRLFDTGRSGAIVAVLPSHDAERLADEFDELLDDVDRQGDEQGAAAAFRGLRIVSSAVSGSMDTMVAAGVTKEMIGTWRAIDDLIVQRALELIWTHSDRPLSVSDVARQLPVTRRTLDRRFSEATGHSVLEEINMCRLRRAKRLLVETDLPVKTIARHAGYSSTERMRVAFVEREGASPTLFRKRTGERRGGGRPAADSEHITDEIGQLRGSDSNVEPLS